MSAIVSPEVRRLLKADETRHQLTRAFLAVEHAAVPQSTAENRPGAQIENAIAARRIERREQADKQTPP